MENIRYKIKNTFTTVKTNNNAEKNTFYIKDMLINIPLTDKTPDGLRCVIFW